jgi:Co/Zn/Cd efflux system component
VISNLWRRIRHSAERIRVGLVALAAAIVWINDWQPLPHLNVLGILGVLFRVFPIISEASTHLLARQLTRPSGNPLSDELSESENVEQIRRVSRPLGYLQVML